MSQTQASSYRNSLSSQASVSLHPFHLLIPNTQPVASVKSKTFLSLYPQHTTQMDGLHLQQGLHMQPHISISTPTASSATVVSACMVAIASSRDSLLSSSPQHPLVATSLSTGSTFGPLSHLTALRSHCSCHAEHVSDGHLSLVPALGTATLERSPFRND